LYRSLSYFTLPHVTILACIHGHFITHTTTTTTATTTTSSATKQPQQESIQTSQSADKPSEPAIPTTSQSELDHTATGETNQCVTTSQATTCSEAEPPQPSADLATATTSSDADATTTTLSLADSEENLPKVAKVTAATGSQASQAEPEEELVVEPPVEAQGPRLQASRLQELRSRPNLHPRITAFIDKLRPPIAKIFHQQERGYAARDLAKYRSGYRSDFPNSSRKTKNVRFYRNKIASEPEGAKIDTIHAQWARDYNRLEVHHGYIQWLFPIPEAGMNWSAQELQRHELDIFRVESNIQRRILKSYRMMLNFYGFELVDEQTGELRKSHDYAPHFSNLNTHSHNYLRITRILKFLGLVGFECYQVPFITAFMEAMLVDNELQNAADSLATFWVGTVLNEEHREQLSALITIFSH